MVIFLNSVDRLMFVIETRCVEVRTEILNVISTSCVLQTKACINKAMAQLLNVLHSSRRTIGYKLGTFIAEIASFIPSLNMAYLILLLVVSFSKELKH